MTQTLNKGSQCNGKALIVILIIGILIGTCVRNEWEDRKANVKTEYIEEEK